jgi:hypothetical protein
MEPTARQNKDVYFDEALHFWLQKTARREHWRIAGWYGIEDLVQDGVVCYCKCRDKYTLKSPDPLPEDLAIELKRSSYQDLNTDHPTDAQRRHFMWLVQRSFINYIMTLSVDYAINREAPVDCSIVEDSNTFLESLLPPQPEEVSVLMALAAAPAEISSAIGCLINDSLEGEAYLRTKLRKKLALTKHSSGGVTASMRVTKGRRALRETTVEYFQRLLGDGDVHQKTADYLYS